jgi:predicted CoA-substrate-specific enzyme activase
MKLTDVCTQNKTDQITGAKTIGIDIGSRSAKGVLIANGEIYTAIIPTGFYMQTTAENLFDLLFKQSGLGYRDVDYVVGTGYGRIAIRLKDIPTQIITEISCHGMGAHFLGEDIRTIIDIGGQDSKAIRIDPSSGKILDFVMNDKCAAGTGRFLEKIANVLGHDVVDIGKISLASRNPAQMNTLCVVFAESEVISDRAGGASVEDLAMGVNISVARRIKNLVSRVGLEDGVLFTGGVSNNTGMRKALEDIIGVKIGTAKIDTVFAGAFGAALYAQKYASNEIQSGSGGGSHARINLTYFRNAVEKKKENYMQKATGKAKNAGYLCSYTPVEILSAADVAHIRLFHTGTPDEIAAGERMTRSVFCDLTKSVLGKFSEDNPLYRVIDRVYTFYTCDCIKKTAEAINTKFVKTSIFNLPRVRDSRNSEEYFKAELVEFVRDLEDFCGTPVSLKEIQNQITLYNRAKQLYRKIAEYRKAENTPLNGREFQELAQGYYYLPADELNVYLEDVLAQLEKIEKPGGRPVRLMIAGGMMAEGDFRLTDIIENQLGACVVVEDNCTGFKPFITDVPETGDVFGDLAAGYLGKAPCARMQKIEDNVQLAVDLAREYQVDGVIYYFLSFCPCYGLAKNCFVQEFQARDIPVLELAGDYSQNDDGQLRTRLEAFIEVLKERSALALSCVL